MVSKQIIFTLFKVNLGVFDLVVKNGYILAEISLVLEPIPVIFWTYDSQKFFT